MVVWFLIVYGKVAKCSVDGNYLDDPKIDLFLFNWWLMGSFHRNISMRVAFCHSCYNKTNSMLMKAVKQ